MKTTNISTIDVHQLKKLLDVDKALCLIDVREPDEWQSGYIPGAVLLPKDEITTKIEAKIADKNHPIYLHCKGGVRSVYAAECLIAMGYKKVFSVEGGIMAWEKSGYVIVKP